MQLAYRSRLPAITCKRITPRVHSIFHPTFATITASLGNEAYRGGSAPPRSTKERTANGKPCPGRLFCLTIESLGSSRASTSRICCRGVQTWLLNVDIGPRDPLQVWPGGNHAALSSASQTSSTSSRRRALKVLRPARCPKLDRYSPRMFTYHSISDQ
jgi:hypothetical protein